MISVAHEDEPPKELTIFWSKSIKMGKKAHVTKVAFETAEAVKFFTKARHYRDEKKLTKKDFVFKIYKDKQLSDHLEKKFHNKCGYCESKVAHVTPKDVDHYRPKASIEGKEYSYRPGYYWLGADWHNLIVACPRCNRSGTHEVYDLANKITLGKASQFPLSSEKKRVRDHAVDVLTENNVRLLLNPYLDKPEEHIVFDEFGLIHPKILANGIPSPKGRMSIEVFALQRQPLVEQRHKMLCDFEFLIDEAEHLLALHPDLRSNWAKTRNSARLEKIFMKMASFFGPGVPYQAMMRQYVNDRANSNRFSALKRFGIDMSALLEP